MVVRRLRQAGGTRLAVGDADPKWGGYHQLLVLHLQSARCERDGSRDVAWAVDPADAGPGNRRMALVQDAETGLV